MRQKFKEIYKEFSDEYPGTYVIATEEFNENGDVISKVTESSIRISSGTEYVSGYAEKKIVPESDGGLCSLSLVKNKDGEWHIYDNGLFFAMTEDNIRTCCAAKLKRVLDGMDPKDEKALRALPQSLAKVGAFVTVTVRQGTFVVIGRKLFNVGCERGWDLLLDAGVINQSGDFLNVKLTDKRLQKLGVSLDSVVLKDLLTSIQGV